MCRLICCFLVFAVTYCSGARILAIVPTPSYSHQVAFRLVWRELSLRGHEVTLLTTDPINDKTLTNLTEIDLHFAYDLWNNKHNITHLIDVAQEDNIGFIKKFVAAIRDIVNEELQHPDVQKLIKNENKQHFDLVIAEFFHAPMYAFSELYQCPLIGISSLEAISTVYHSMGSPAHPVLHPDVSLPFVPPLNFIERIISTLYMTYLKYYIQFVVLPDETLTVRNYFGEHFPTMEQIKSRVSLMFVNVDPIFSVVRPLVPAIIPIGGGSHIKQVNALPKHIQEFLDDGPEGVIYFSLGTNVKRGNIRDQTVAVLLKTFSELPYKVLWKIDADNFSNKSDNVLISKWLPQQDVLKHANVKLFITQGGWQSIEESIYSHTPMIGMPFFGDQPTNIKKMVARGIALSVDHKSLTKEDFKGTILELMKNPRYRNKVKELAELAQDQPMTGLERAVWWTEYVLRHKGAEHLKSPAIDLPFYQYYLLDVISFCSLVIIVFISLLVVAVRLLFNTVNYLNLLVKVKVKVL